MKYIRWFFMGLWGARFLAIPLIIVFVPCVFDWEFRYTMWWLGTFIALMAIGLITVLGRMGDE